MKAKRQTSVDEQVSDPVGIDLTRQWIALNQIIAKAIDRHFPSATKRDKTNIGNLFSLVSGYLDKSLPRNGQTKIMTQSLMALGEALLGIGSFYADESKASDPNSKSKLKSDRKVRRK